MLGGDLISTDGASAGSWIEPRLGGEFGAVTLQVPKGFEAYARVFHPATDPDRTPVSWKAVVEAVGRTAHREMQWHALVGSSDSFNFTGSKWAGGNPSLGGMDIPTLDALCGALALYTADPTGCFFGLCVIQSWEDSFTADELRHPYLKLPMGRNHIVLAGPLSAVDQIIRDWSKPSEGRLTLTFGRDEGPVPPASRRFREAPNLIWPVDQTWLVASEVDFDSTLVGGSAELIKAIIESPELEAWAVEPTDALAADADRINAPSYGLTRRAKARPSHSGASHFCVDL